MGRSVGGIDLNSCFSQLFIRQNRPVLPPSSARRRQRVPESAKPQLTSIPHSRANSWLELMTGSRSRTSPRLPARCLWPFEQWLLNEPFRVFRFPYFFFLSLRVCKTCQFPLRYLPFLFHEFRVWRQCCFSSNFPALVLYFTFIYCTGEKFTPRNSSFAYAPSKHAYRAYRPINGTLSANPTHLINRICPTLYGGEVGNRGM